MVVGVAACPVGLLLPPVGQRVRLRVVGLVDEQEDVAVGGILQVDVVSLPECAQKPMPAHGGVSTRRRRCTVSAVDRLIRWSTALAVLGVAVVASVVSYEHAGALVRPDGESGLTGRLIPLTVDGLIYASSMVMLESARRGRRVPKPTRWLLGLGIVATLAANVTHGVGQGMLDSPLGGILAQPVQGVDIGNSVCGEPQFLAVRIQCSA